MTTIQTKDVPLRVADVAPYRSASWSMRRRRRVGHWLVRHRVDLVVGGALLMIVGVVHAINVGGFPQFFEDEATYVAQAWALSELGSLSHYTYWYDHPPAGWIQIGAWASATFGWDRASSAMLVGREAAFVTNMVSVVLLYVLARRVGFQRVPAFIAVLLFGLSPLAIQFHRMALLDNMLMPWLLGALVLALSPRRRLVAYGASGLCLAVACLTKITSGFFLPVVMYLIYREAPPSIRRYALSLSASAFAGFGLMWPLMALIKGEFFFERGVVFPGVERVSLLGTQWWVLFRRPYDGGSVLDATSSARAELHALWLQHDTWLLGLGLIAAVILVVTRRYRWIGVMYLVTALVVIRPAELSFPYVITYLPLAALSIGGVMDLSFRAVKHPPAWLRAMFARVWPRARPELAIAAAWVPLALLIPAWWPGIVHATTHDANANFRASAAWLQENVPDDATILVDNVTWVDLVLDGRDRENVVWMYKLELDPEVIEVHGNWTSFDYVTSTEFARRQRYHLSQLDAALDSSTIVAAFRERGFPYEDVEIRQILAPRDEVVDTVAAPARSVPAAEPLRSGAAPRPLALDSGAQPPTHVVLPGNTLSQIAVDYGVDLAEFVALNGIADPDLILRGTVLDLPSTL